jgi:thiosulfate/3-mercaptopyruvate sulfurtransferase
VTLPHPEYDGDYRVESGYGRYLEGHIPTARHADLISGLSDTTIVYHFARLTAPRLARVLERLGVEDGSAVVVYDAEYGLWAARIWWMLRWIGVPAAVLDGGWGQWLARGGAVECDDARHLGSAPDAAGTPRGRLTPGNRPEMWVGREDVAQIMDGSRPGRLVCALPSEVFSGGAITRYARRGHIPTSVNVPARTLLGPDDRLLEPDQLSAVLGGLETEPGPIVVYCGGGISASVLALALTVLGREDVSIYDGSLEEWCADRRLPLQVGPSELKSR